MGALLNSAVLHFSYLPLSFAHLRISFLCGLFIRRFISLYNMYTSTIKTIIGIYCYWVVFVSFLIIHVLSLCHVSRQSIICPSCLHVYQTFITESCHLGAIISYVRHYSFCCIFLFAIGKLFSCVPVLFGQPTSLSFFCLCEQFFTQGPGCTLVPFSVAGGKCQQPVS